MTTKRLSILQTVLVLGLGSVFLIPRHVRMEPAAINLSLPESVGSWEGTDESVTQFERDVLGPDTQFVRKLYKNPRGDEIYVSIVLSGPDMNTSIHRPERCLPAQGWTVADVRTITLPLPHDTLRATRLHNMRNVKTESGRTLTIYALDYYWFVGHSDETPSHLERTWIDIRDRIFKGRNQQWAYVMVGSTITKDFKIFGRDEKQTEEVIQSFIAQLLPQLRKHAISGAG